MKNVFIILIFSMFFMMFGGKGYAEDHILANSYVTYASQERAKNQYHITMSERVSRAESLKDCVFHPVEPVEPNPSQYIGFISTRGNDFNLRLGGSFSYLYQSVDYQTVDWVNDTLTGVKHSGSFEHLLGSGHLQLSFCFDWYCIGIEQELGAIYSYPGMSPEPYGITYGLMGVRFGAGSRSIITFNFGVGGMYLLASEDYKLFIKDISAIAYKLEFDWTIYLIPEFGFGFHLSPALLAHGMASDDENKDTFEELFFKLNLGIHITFRY